jgi:hypothetical protein
MLTANDDAYHWPVCATKPEAHRGLGVFGRLELYEIRVQHHLHGASGDVTFRTSECRNEGFPFT